MSNIESKIHSNENRGTTISDLAVTEKDELIDSLAVLLGISFGDVRSGLNAGGFEEMAIKALRAFKRKYYKHYLGELGPDVEIDDLKLLQDSLEAVEIELCNAVEPHIRIPLEKEQIEIQAAIRRVKEENALYNRLQDEQKHAGLS